MMKAVNYIFTALAVVGVFFIVGVCGRSDLYDEIHLVYPVTELVKQVIIGLMLILPECVYKLLYLRGSKDDKRVF